MKNISPQKLFALSFITALLLLGFSAKSQIALNQLVAAPPGSVCVIATNPITGKATYSLVPSIFTTPTLQQVVNSSNIFSGFLVNTINHYGSIGVSESSAGPYIGGVSLRWDDGTTNGVVMTADGYSALQHSVLNKITAPDNNVYGNFSASDDGFNSHQLSIDANGITFTHDTRIQFDCPVYSFSNEYANSLCYFDSNNYLKSATLGSGLSLTSGTLSATGTSSTTILTASTGISLTGTAPNYTVTNSLPNVTQSLSISSNTITLSGGGGSVTIPTNSTTILTASTNVTITGIAPNYTISSPSQSLSISGNTISLSATGGSVTIPTQTTGLQQALTAGNNISITSNTISSTTPTLSVVNGSLSGSYPTQTLTINTQTTGLQPQLNGTGFVKTTGTTISYDNSTYLTGNQSITLSGDITGSGATALTTSLATVNSNTGSFGSTANTPTYTVNGKGLITASGTVAIIIPIANVTGLTTSITAITSSLSTNTSNIATNTSAISTLSTNLALKQDFPLRESMGDANKTFSAGKTQVTQTVALTAPRTLTLPAANAFSAGQSLSYIDEIGGVSNSNYVTLTRVGSDLINGSSNQILNVQYGAYNFVTDGSSKWTLLNLTDASAGTWTPTVTGYTTYTVTGAKWTLQGDLCIASCKVNGTSNASGLTVTMPFNGIVNTRAIIPNVDAGATNGEGLIELAAVSNVATCYKTAAAGGFTGSGTKTIWITLIYPFR